MVGLNEIKITRWVDDPATLTLSDLADLISSTTHCRILMTPTPVLVCYQLDFEDRPNYPKNDVGLPTDEAMLEVYLQTRRIS